jgi:hypothetical protein
MLSGGFSGLYPLGLANRKLGQNVEKGKGQWRRSR